jgi:hypothetical protein
LADTSASSDARRHPQRGRMSRPEREARGRPSPCRQPQSSPQPMAHQAHVHSYVDPVLIRTGRRRGSRIDRHYHGEWVYAR